MANTVVSVRACHVPPARSVRRWMRATLGVATIALWIAIGRLMAAFLTSDMSFRLVAENSRRTAPWPYRLAATWGSAEGSLLLFTGVVAAVACVVGRRASARQAAVALATVAALTLIVVVFTDPFDRLAIPAVDGFGLNPILEHPAMAIHPPLLYLGLAMTLPAALVAFDRGSIDVRRWLLTSISVLTLAMALGGLWSYVEQGWGGYWAWDPVENTSLAPWLAALVAVHVRAWRRAPALLAVPWLLVLYGSALARSGGTPSVHAFADSAAIGWSLMLVAVITTLALGIARRADPPRPIARLGWRALPVALIGSALAVVVVLTAGPVLLQILGQPPGRVAGTYFARALGLLAAGALAALIVVAVRARHQVRGPAWVAHVGFVVLLAGVAGSSFDRSETVTVDPGATATVAGVEVRNLGIDVREGPRLSSRAVVAQLDVAGQLLEPALVALPDRGGVLSETTLVTRPWHDVQVALVRALDDGRALIEVRVKPLVQLVWLGAVTITLGTVLSLRARRHGHALASSPAAR